MVIKTSESDGNSKIFVDYDELQMPAQNMFTLETLRRESDDTTSYRMEDFEQALRKVGRRIKK